MKKRKGGNTNDNFYTFISHNNIININNIYTARDFYTTYLHIRLKIKYNIVATFII